MTDSTRYAPRSAVSLFILIALGTVYWLLAALVVRWTAAGWVGSTVATIVVFGLIVVVTYPALFIGMRVARVDRAAASFAAIVMTMAALLLDGIALTWFPALYGTDPKVVLGGAAAIMFGAGAALLIGLVVQRR